MKTITTQQDAMLNIMQNLNGKIKISEIKRNQILTCHHGQSVNDLLFVAYKFGVYFYTSRSAFDSICYLENKKMPTYVVSKESNIVFEIK